MNPPIRLLHLGDLHLGVELYGRPDPAEGYGTRTGDFLAALDRALALAADADVVLFPGDVYKSCDPTPTIQREFGRRVRAAAREIPVVIIPGNHDQPAASGRASSVDIFHVLELEGVHVLRRPQVREVATRRGPLLVAGLPFVPRGRVLTPEETRGIPLLDCVRLLEERLVEQINGLAAEVTQARERLGAAVPAILTAHYTIRGVEFGGYGRPGLLSPEVELPLGAVKRREFDYVALGHIHRFQVVPKNDFTSQPPVVYPGSIERIDFGEEKEDKVVVLAEISRGHAAFRPVALAPRRFLTLRLEASAEDPLGSLAGAIRKRSADIEGSIVRLRYTLPPGAPPPSERELRRELAAAFCVASVRVEEPEGQSRARHGEMTTALAPLVALDQFIQVDPRLLPLREALLDRARNLVLPEHPESL